MNFNIIIVILGFASSMNLLHKTDIYHKWLEDLLLDVKPFNCVACSTFWVTLGYTLFSNPSQAIFISAIAAIMAELINIQIHKL